MESQKPIPQIKIRQSAVILTFKILLFTFFADTTYWTTTIITPQLLKSHTTLFLSLIGIKLTIICYLVLRWSSEHIAIDDDFIIHKKGILFIKQNHIKLDTIEEISFEQGILGRIFRYASIHIKQSNSETDFLHAIPYPKQFIYLVEKKISEQ